MSSSVTRQDPVVESREIEVWACPIPGCGNYYGASSVAGQDLGAIPNFEADMVRTVASDPAHPKVVSHRGDCPTHRGVQRVRLTVSIRVPVRVLPVV